MGAARDYLQSEISRYFQKGTAFHRFLQEAAYLPRCSIGKAALRRGEMLIRPRESAVKYPYMQVNRPSMVSWLVFDLDHSNPFIWEDQRLPPPNFIVGNPKNGKSHLYYAIIPVCTSERAHSKPIAYMKAVYEAMAARLEADPSYSGPVAKTPGHPWWRTCEIHSQEYSLGELEDYVDLAVKPLWSTGPDLEAVLNSRHCLLFEELRYYAYSIVTRERTQGTFESFLRLLDAYAHAHNHFKRRGFDINLSVAQVKTTVKSVARWTWDRYTGDRRCHRGVMGLASSIPLQEKQQRSARRTHELRQKATESRIRKAVRRLVLKGEILTQTGIAAVARLSRQTVSKYSAVIQEVTSALSKTVVPLVTGKTNNVKYGVHQISASSRGRMKGADCRESGPVQTSNLGLIDYFSLLRKQLCGIPPPEYE